MTFLSNQQTKPISGVLVGAKTAKTSDCRAFAQRKIIQDGGKKYLDGVYSEFR